MICLVVLRPISKPEIKVHIFIDLETSIIYAINITSIYEQIYTYLPHRTFTIFS